MGLRVVCWNMNHWQRSQEQRADAWDYLRSLSPDFALLQEWLPASGEGVRVVHKAGGISSSRPWGSAVVSFGPELTELRAVTTKYSPRALSLHGTAPGTVAVAHVPSLELTLISMYGLIEEGYAVTTVHRQLSDLTPLFDTAYGRRVILGGDLNLSSQFRSPDGPRHRNVFDRLGTLGLVDALSLDRPKRVPLDDCPCADRPCRHVQTLRHGRSKTPWQNDYLFVSDKMADLVGACRPLCEGTPDPWSLSDHCPLLLELDLP